MQGKPPLLIVPNYPLATKADVESFEEHAAAVLDAEDDKLISFPFPVTLYQRIDGIWLPVSDLGAFHSPPAPGKPEPVESTYVPDSQRQWVPCEDGD